MGDICYSILLNWTFKQVIANVFILVLFKVFKKLSYYKQFYFLLESRGFQKFSVLIEGM